MYKHCVHAELLKLRRSRIWLILLVIPIISVLIGSANFYMNQGVLKKEWYSLWSQVGLFYGEFFFPILIAICCAYVWRIEHLNKNWHIILTSPTSIASIFISKLLVTGVLLLFVQGFFFLLYYIAGLIIGLTTNLPKEIFGWLIRGWIAGITICALQLTLSMRIRSFAIPIGIGLVATFFGLALYVIDLGMFFPHSLLTIGMGVLSQIGFSSVFQHLLFVIINLTYSIIFGFYAIKWMKKNDVVV